MNQPPFLSRMEDKMHQKLVRTSSLEKIKRFNNYICSPHYYALPALLAWVRSSQSALQVSTEKTIFFFRSVIFKIFYKLYILDIKTIIYSSILLAFSQLKKSYKSINSSTVLKLVVYLSFVVLVLELGLCLYMLYEFTVPNGMIFLCICWFYIIFIKSQSAFVTTQKQLYFMKTKDL